jgi:hypothetical protein
MRGLKPKASMRMASSTRIGLLDLRAKPLIGLTASLCNLHIVPGYGKVEMGMDSKHVYILRDGFNYSEITLHNHLQH